MKLRSATGRGASSQPDFYSAQVSGAQRFHLNLNPSAKAGLVVVCAGVEQCSSKYAVRRRSFPFYAVEYVAGGIGALTIHGSEYRLEAGSVFSYGPGIQHEILTHPERTLIKYFADFAGGEAGQLLKECGLAPGRVLNAFPPLNIQGLFDELIRLGLQGTPRTPAICERLLQAILLKMADSCVAHGDGPSLASTTYQRCRDHIQRHFLRLRSLHQLAAECQVDDTYICRLFQRYDHLTPSRLLLHLKMNYAAERLRTPGVLAKQVAEDTGFANQFHFSRVFKSVFGVSPRAVTKMR